MDAECLERCLGRIQENGPTMYPFEDSDEKAKNFFEACKDQDSLSNLDLDVATLKSMYKYEMNIFHVILVYPKEKSWKTKKHDIPHRKKVVGIIEAICQRFPEQVKKMMLQKDVRGRTPLHYAVIIDFYAIVYNGVIIDVDNEEEDSNITLALLKHGADEALFMEDENKETPASTIGISNLRAHLDTFSDNRFDGLDEKTKKLFEACACKELHFLTLEDLEEKAKKMLETVQYEGLKLDDDTKRFLQTRNRQISEKTCHDHFSILDLDEATLIKLDKYKMNIFHLLLFDPKQKWNTKKRDTLDRKKVVGIIEAICQKFPEQVKPMMLEEDIFGRTPLHYAGIIDVDNEKEDSNITLALLKYGADKALFMKDRKQERPVSFIGTSNLRAHLDTKLETRGPVGHGLEEFQHDTSILVPKDESNKDTLNFGHLETLAEKHRDLFDHRVISAMIW